MILHRLCSDSLFLSLLLLYLSSSCTSNLVCLCLVLTHTLCVLDHTWGMRLCGEWQRVTGQRAGTGTLALASLLLLHRLLSLYPHLLTPPRIHAPLIIIVRCLSGWVDGMKCMRRTRTIMPCAPVCAPLSPSVYAQVLLFKGACIAVSLIRLFQGLLAFCCLLLSPHHQQSFSCRKMAWVGRGCGGRRSSGEKEWKKTRGRLDVMKMMKKSAEHEPLQPRDKKTRQERTKREGKREEGRQQW